MRFSDFKEIAILFCGSKEADFEQQLSGVRRRLFYFARPRDPPEPHPPPFTPSTLRTTIHGGAPLPMGVLEAPEEVGDGLPLPEELLLQGRHLRLRTVRPMD